MKLSAAEFLPAPKPTAQGRVISYADPTPKEERKSRPEQIYAEHKSGKHICQIAFEKGITKGRVKRIIRDMERGCYIQGPAK